jgi:hypothetical protein
MNLRCAALSTARTTARSAGRADARPGAQPTTPRQARRTARTTGRSAAQRDGRTDHSAPSARRRPTAGAARSDLSASLVQPPREPGRPRAGKAPAACGGCEAGSLSQDPARRHDGVRCRLGSTPRRLAGPRRADSGGAQRRAGPRPKSRQRAGRGVAGPRGARGLAAWYPRGGSGPCPGPGQPHRDSEASRSRLPTSRTGRCRRRGAARALAGCVVAAWARPAAVRWGVPFRTRSRRCESGSAGRCRWRGGRGCESCVQCRRCQPRAIGDLADPAAYPMSY